MENLGFGDLGRERVLDCLQAFHLRTVDVIEKGIPVVEFGKEQLSLE